MIKNDFLSAMVKIVLLGGIFLLSFKSYSYTQETKQWLGINVQQALDQHRQWHAYGFSQLRFIDREHPVQIALLEGGLGYQLNAETIGWLGYRWSAKDPFNGFYQENRFFQQLITQKKLFYFKLNDRLRLEEITHGNASQISLRLRERLMFQANRSFLNYAYFSCWDEIFFQLNHTVFEPHTLIGENRLFVGFNYYVSQHAWWEIGYINQYKIRSPSQSQNQMSHIITLTYNRVD